MNRFNLPDVNFLEKSPEDIERDILLHISEITGITLSNADPRRAWVKLATLIITQERNNADYGLKQNLLAYAEDEFLDHKGESTSTTRLASRPAATTIEFIFEEERVSVLVIEEGTLFLVGENTFFEMTETIVIPVGQHSVEVIAYCTENGEKGNGYLPGEISVLVNPLPWVKEVKNLTTSSGGAEVEENDAYAHRIRIAPESFSVAGPEGAYEYWAKTTSQDIVDVSILSPSAGIVEIRVLLENGEIPSQELLAQVLEVCSDRTRRPLTDYVTVQAPEQVSYDIDATYWILESNVFLVQQIQSDIDYAFRQYIKWQKEKMGRNINLSELIARLKNAGAHRVSVDSIMFQEIEKFQVANENDINLNFGGLTDE